MPARSRSPLSLPLPLCFQMPARSRSPLSLPPSALLPNACSFSLPLSSFHSLILKAVRASAPFSAFPVFNFRPAQSFSCEFRAVSASAPSKSPSIAQSLPKSPFAPFWYSSLACRSGFRLFGLLCKVTIVRRSKSIPPPLLSVFNIFHPANPQPPPALDFNNG